MNRITVQQIASALVLTTLFGGATPALAHEDLPGPPALRVKGYVKDVKLTAGFDNEPGEENWVLNIRFDHQGHGVRELSAYGVGVKPPFCDEHFGGLHDSWETKSGEDIPVNHAGRNAHPNANELRWSHIDCTPRNTVLLAAELIEKDVDEFGEAFMDFLMLGLPVVGNVAWWLVGLPRGNENYGKGLGQLPENGTVEVALVGGAGGAATVTFEGSTEQANAVDCLGGEFDEYAALSFDERMEPFDGLETALALADNLQIETGNPGALTSQEVADQRRLGRELTMGAAQWLSGSEIQAAAGLQGVGEAIAQFEVAQLAALEGMDDDAMNGFRTAYSIATQLLDEPMPGELPTFLDRQVAMLPGFVAVAPDGYFEVGGTILGLRPGDTITLVTLENQVAGMYTNFAPAAAERVALLTSLDLGSVPAGQLMGMRRIDGGSVQGPNASCSEPHLTDFTFGGIFVDGVGPYLDPDPAGCGFGTLEITSLPVRGGGIVPGSTFESDGFVLEAEFGGVEPGTYALNLRAEILTGGGGTVVLNAPLTAVVQSGVHPIFSDGFEEGLTRWSSVGL